jgi:hypothetical protein
MASGAVLVALGLIGLAAGWGSTSPHPVAAPSSAPSTAGVSTTPTPTTGAPETPDGFLAQFVTALHGDSTFLFDRLDAAVIARYGADQCRAFVPKLIDPAAQLHLVSVRGPTSYAWQTHGLTVTVDMVYEMDVDGVVMGVSGPRTYHFALVDGRFRIFVDCGTPLPGAP